MDVFREYVSSHALQRAIRAQLIRDNGIDTDYVLIPFAVEVQTAPDSPSNWSMVIDPVAVAEKSLDAVRAAADAVAARYQLERRRVAREPAPV